MPRRWSIGWIRWGIVGCYVARTTEATVMPGGDIGLTNLDFDEVVSGTPWAAHGTGEIEITPTVPPEGWYTIRVTGVMTSTEAVYVQIRLYDSSHAPLTTIDLGPIGPGTSVPFTFITSPIPDSRRFIEFDLYDPDGGGGELEAGAEVEVCGIAAPG